MNSDRPGLLSGPADHAALWETLRRLLDGLLSSLDRATYLDDGLDAIVELMGADRGLLLLLQDGTEVVVNARGGGRALLPHEREEVSKTILHKVRKTGKRVVFEAGGDPSESVAALGITSALAAPLKAVSFGREGPLRGILYVDVRDPSRRLVETHLEFFRAAAILLSLVLDLGEELRAAREEARQARAREAPVPGAPDLDELLRFPSLADLRQEARSCLAGEGPILILGESGTGKTLLAWALAAASGRKPVVRATLGSSDDLNTVASELFGHERGAFSGAIARRTGLVESAHGGTLILDEVLNLDPRAQQLLLDFTQFGSYRPLGWDRPEPKHSRVRLIAATNGDLEAAMREGRFRRDLYYRLAGVRLKLPPLRDRRADVVPLAEARLRRSDPGREWQIALPLRRLLLSERLPWPGNVRQLEHAIDRARERALASDPDGTRLGPEHVQATDLGLATLELPTPGTAEGSEPVSAGFQIEPEQLADTWRRLKRERETLDALERRTLELALERRRGVVADVARELGVSRTGLLSRLRTLGVARR